MMRNLRRAFTLIELLTVMAITAVLLTLIIVPVFQSFQLSRNAQAFADAQEKGRTLTDTIAREIGSSVGVRDLSGSDPFVVNGTLSQVPRHALVVRVPQVTAAGRPQNSDTPTTVEIVLPYVKMDVYRPAQTPTLNARGELVDPDTGKADPTLIAPKGDLVLPAAPGTTIKRFWVGLRDPFSPYNEPYTGLLMRRNSQRDNLYVLYEAEVPIFRPNGQVNTDYFFDQAADNSASTTGPLLDDPRFFDPGSPFPNGGYVSGTGPDKATVVRNWLSRARILTEVSRYDMLLATYDRGSRAVANVGGVPNVLPLIQFRPTRISNDVAEGRTAVQLGEESANASLIGPDIFTTELGNWSNVSVRVWPGGTVAAGPNDVYLVGRREPLAGNAGRSGGFSVYAFDPSSMTDDQTQGTEVFDVDAYETATRYPFSEAVQKANLRSNWLDNPVLRQTFVPFFVQPGQGRIIASFGISEVGTTPTASGLPNLPIADTGAAVSPTQDAGAGAVWGGSGYQINAAFNRAWNQFPDLRGQLHRYIDLRVARAEDGTPSPLYPAYIGGATGFGSSSGSRVAIVPGSVEVYGPDQLPGPNFGNSIRYTRSTGEPGPNQYRINYVDQPEPRNSSNAIDYSVLFPGMSNPPATYDPANFVSGALQPRFRAGYIQLNSDPNSPIPAGAFRVDYRFQFTTGGNQGQATRVAVEYDSRDLMSVQLTVRNYPQSSAPNPQAATLKATAKVRNYVR